DTIIVRTTRMDTPTFIIWKPENGALTTRGLTSPFAAKLIAYESESIARSNKKNTTLAVRDHYTFNLISSNEKTAMRCNAWHNLQLALRFCSTGVWPKSRCQSELQQNV